MNESSDDFSFRSLLDGDNSDDAIIREIFAKKRNKPNRGCLFGNPNAQCDDNNKQKFNIRITKKTEPINKLALIESQPNGDGDNDKVLPLPKLPANIFNTPKNVQKRSASRIPLSLNKPHQQILKHIFRSGNPSSDPKNVNSSKTVNLTSILQSGNPQATSTPFNAFVRNHQTSKTLNNPLSQQLPNSNLISKNINITSPKSKKTHEYAQEIDLNKTPTNQSNLLSQNVSYSVTPKNHLSVKKRIDFEGSNDPKSLHVLSTRNDGNQAQQQSKCNETSDASVRHGEIAIELTEDENSSNQENEKSNSCSEPFNTVNSSGTINNRRPFCPGLPIVLSPASQVINDISPSTSIARYKEILEKKKKNNEQQNFLRSSVNIIRKRSKKVNRNVDQLKKIADTIIHRQKDSNQKQRILYNKQSISTIENNDIQKSNSSLDTRSFQNIVNNRRQKLNAEFKTITPMPSEKQQCTTEDSNYIDESADNSEYASVESNDTQGNIQEKLTNHRTVQMSLSSMRIMSYNTTNSQSLLIQTENECNVTELDEEDIEEDSGQEVNEREEYEKNVNEKQKRPTFNEKDNADDVNNEQNESNVSHDYTSLNESDRWRDYDNNDQDDDDQVDNDQGDDKVEDVDANIYNNCLRKKCFVHLQILSKSKIEKITGSVGNKNNNYNNNKIRDIINNNNNDNNNIDNENNSSIESNSGSNNEKKRRNDDINSGNFDLRRSKRSRRAPIEYWTNECAPRTPLKVYIYYPTEDQKKTDANKVTKKTTNSQKSTQLSKSQEQYEQIRFELMKDHQWKKCGQLDIISRKVNNTKTGMIIFPPKSTKPRSKASVFMTFFVLNGFLDFILHDNTEKRIYQFEKIAINAGEKYTITNKSEIKVDLCFSTKMEP